MRDTLKIECLLEALENYMEARHEHDKARDEYTGYSWGYYGRDYIEKKEKAAEVFQEKLEEIVKEIKQ